MKSPITFQEINVFLDRIRNEEAQSTCFNSKWFDELRRSSESSQAFLNRLCLTVKIRSEKMVSAIIVLQRLSEQGIGTPEAVALAQEILSRRIPFTEEDTHVAIYAALLLCNKNEQSKNTDTITIRQTPELLFKALWEKDAKIQIPSALTILRLKRSHTLSSPLELQTIGALCEVAIRAQKILMSPSKDLLDLSNQFISDMKAACAYAGPISDALSKSLDSMSILQTVSPALHVARRLKMAGMPNMENFLGDSPVESLNLLGKPKGLSRAL